MFSLPSSYIHTSRTSRIYLLTINPSITIYLSSQKYPAPFQLHHTIWKECKSWIMIFVLLNLFYNRLSIPRIQDFQENFIKQSLSCSTGIVLKSVSTTLSYSLHPLYRQSYTLSTLVTKVHCAQIPLHYCS